MVIPTITLINADCLPAMREMEDNQYSLALVDPPYGIGLAMINNGAHGTKQKRKEKRYKPIHDVEKDWNNEPPGPEYFEELHRVTKNQIIWGCNYYAQHIPAVGRIYHDKETGFEGTKINFTHGDLASCSLQKRITIFRYRWSGNKQGGTINWYNTGIDKRIHPTQKPVALYKWLLRNYAKKGDTILDTHGGSMSLAIACHDYGFDLTCFELDAEYYAAAVKRLDDHRSQLRLEL